MTISVCLEGMALSSKQSGKIFISTLSNPWEMSQDERSQEILRLS
jgi:hypothetical protein